MRFLPATTRRSRALPALAVLLATLLAYLSFPSVWGWNENSRLALVMAAVDRGTLAIDAYHARPGTETGDKSIHAGHHYSDKAIGTALLGAPAYALARPFLARHEAVPERHAAFARTVVTWAAVSIPAAIAVALLFALAHRASGDARTATLVAAAAALGSPLWPYATVLFGHATAAALLLVAFVAVRAIRDGHRRPASLAAACGLALGLAIVTEYPTAPVALLLGAYLAYALATREARDAASGTAPVPARLRPVAPAFAFAPIGASFSSVVAARAAPAPPGAALVPRGLAAALLAGAVPIALLLAYNAAAFGSPLTLGYARIAGPEFVEVHRQGLLGVGLPQADRLLYVTVHPVRGLFAQAPVLAMGLVGLVPMWRRGWRAEAALVAASLAVLLAIAAGFPVWWGGRSFAARHLVPAVLLLCVPIAFLGPRARAVAWALLAVSVVQMGIPTLVSPTFVDETGFADRLAAGPLPWTGSSPIWNESWAGLVAGELRPTLGVQLGVPRGVFLAGLAVAILALFARAARDPGP